MSHHRHAARITAGLLATLLVLFTLPGLGGSHTPQVVAARASTPHLTADAFTLTYDPFYLGFDPFYLGFDPFYLGFDPFYLGFDQAAFAPAAVNQWALTTIQAAAAQQMSTGQGITVAVLDTGVDTSHRLLAAHIAPGGYDYVNQTTVISDVMGGLASGHGTFVAGLIAQVAPNARILPYRVIDTNGQADANNVAAAIIAAVNAGASVINMSMDISVTVPVLQSAVQYAHDHGVAMVAAAGNQSSALPHYPAAYSGVTGVAGTTATDTLASFSNYGSWVTVSAPSTGLLSTYPGGGYAAGSGTSFAAPLVAGEIALLCAAHTNTSCADNAQKVTDGSVSITAVNPGYADMLGAGRINALLSLQNAAKDH